MPRPMARRGPRDARSRISRRRSRRAFAGGGVHLVDVPVDYSENTRVLVDELRNRTPDVDCAEAAVPVRARQRREETTMLKVVQAFDRAPIAEIETDDAAALERKLQAAERVFRDRDGWLKPHQRIAILRRLAALMEAQARSSRPADRARRRQAAARRHRRDHPRHRRRPQCRRRAAQFRRPRDPDGALGGGGGPLGLHDPGADRHRRGDLGLQSSAEPDRPPGGAGHRRRLSGDREACRARRRSPACDFVALVHEAGLPEAWCQSFISEDNALAEQLATDPRVAFLSFIGSARVGWSAARASSHLARVGHWSTAAWRRRSSTAAPISARSSSRSSRAATTMRARSACRRSASTCTRTSLTTSSSASSPASKRCASAIPR